MNERPDPSKHLVGIFVHVATLQMPRDAVARDPQLFGYLLLGVALMGPIEYPVNSSGIEHGARGPSKMHSKRGEA